jgi:trans-aconitate 2-methyltransferase
MDLLEWDAATYDSLPLPHVRWGAGVIERLQLTGNEQVMDLGCGTGRDTKRLLELLPNGRVVAVDGSTQMLDRLRAKLGDSLDRVEVIRADLTEPFPDQVRGDAAISVATFHWVPDHRDLFGRVANALSRGARFEAEFGGAGNLDHFLAAFRKAGGRAIDDTWVFATAEETASALKEAGFVDIEVRTVNDPVQLERGDQLQTFIATVLLGATITELPAEQARSLVRATAAALTEPVIDYVRMQLSATKA